MELKSVYTSMSTHLPLILNRRKFTQHLRLPMQVLTNNDLYWLVTPSVIVTIIIIMVRLCVGHTKSLSVCASRF